MQVHRRDDAHTLVHETFRMKVLAVVQFEVLQAIEELPIVIGYFRISPVDDTDGNVSGIDTDKIILQHLGNLEIRGNEE